MTDPLLPTPSIPTPSPPVTVSLATSEQPRRVVAITFALNLALCAGHFIVWGLTGSQLVLAQGADSLVDLGVGVVLLVTIKVGAQPRDANHPFGHQRAEPIGVLVTAVLAAVLAFEVARSAVVALFVHAVPDVDASVLGVLGAKLLLKLLLLFVVLRHSLRSRSQAVDATRIDTLNDVLTSGSSLLGVAAVRAGWPSADALFALPVAAYIAWNGWKLARASLRFLMGEAPAPEVMQELVRSAAAVAGVLSVKKVRAHYVGSELHAEVTVLIAPGSSAKEGHDIALDVHNAVERHPLVGEVFIHVDTGEGKDGT